MTVTNRGMKLLYVHDNAKGEDSLQKKLIRNGASVAQTRRLEEYMDRVKQDEFDAVLLDLTRLENSGVDVCERLSREAPDVPVVALTEHHDEAKAVNAIAAGAQDYLVKSRVSTTDLALRIRAALAAAGPRGRRTDREDAGQCGWRR